MPVAAAGSPPPNRSTIASARSWLNVGEPYSSPTTLTWLAGSRGSFGRHQDLRREVVPRRAVQPARSDDADRPTTVQVRRPRDLLALRLGVAVWVARRDGIVRTVGSPVGPQAVEDLVRRHHQQVEATRRTGARQHAGRHAIAADREVRVAGAAVHVGPGRRVDDDLRAITVEHDLDALGRIEVEVGPGPRDRSMRTRERRLAQRRDQRASEPTAGAGDGDPHQPADRNRDPYWRS